MSKIPAKLHSSIHEATDIPIKNLNEYRYGTEAYRSELLPKLIEHKPELAAELEAHFTKAPVGPVAKATKAARRQRWRKKRQEQAVMQEHPETGDRSISPNKTLWWAAALSLIPVIGMVIYTVNYYRTPAQVSPETAPAVVTEINESANPFGVQGETDLPPGAFPPVPDVGSATQNADATSAEEAVYEVNVESAEPVVADYSQIAISSASFEPDPAPIGVATANQGVSAPIGLKRQADVGVPIGRREPVQQAARSPLPSPTPTSASPSSSGTPPHSGSSEAVLSPASDRPDTETTLRTVSQTQTPPATGPSSDSTQLQNSTTTDAVYSAYLESLFSPYNLLTADVVRPVMAVDGVPGGVVVQVSSCPEALGYCPVIEFFGAAEVFSGSYLRATFEQVRVDDQVYGVRATLLNTAQQEFVVGNVRDVSPTLAVDLFRNALAGFSDYVDGTLNSSRVTQEGDLTIVEDNMPNLSDFILGSAAETFALRQRDARFVRVVELEAGTPVQIQVEAPLNRVD